MRQADLAPDPGWITTDRIKTESANKATHRLYKSQADWEGWEERRTMISRWEMDRMAGAHPRRSNFSGTDD